MGTSVSRSGISVVPRQEPELIWTDAPPWNFSTDTKMASYWKRCVSVSCRTVVYCTTRARPRRARTYTRTCTRAYKL